MFDLDLTLLASTSVQFMEQFADHFSSLWLLLIAVFFGFLALAGFFRLMKN